MCQLRPSRWRRPGLPAATREAGGSAASAAPAAATLGPEGILQVHRDTTWLYLLRLCSQVGCVLSGAVNAHRSSTWQAPGTPLPSRETQGGT